MGIRVKALAGSVWFGKPLRLISFEAIGLFESAAYRVLPAGTGFAIQGVRDARVEDRVYGSAEAAKAEILRREPVRV